MDIIEKLIAGTLGTTAVLGLAVWVLWTRMNARDALHEAAMERKDILISGIVDKTTAALTSLREAVQDQTQATESLRDAIDRGEHRAPRRTNQSA